MDSEEFFQWAANVLWSEAQNRKEPIFFVIVKSEEPDSNNAYLLWVGKHTAQDFQMFGEVEFEPIKSVEHLAFLLEDCPRSFYSSSNNIPYYEKSIYLQAQEHDIFQALMENHNLFNHDSYWDEFLPIFTQLEHWQQLSVLEHNRVRFKQDQVTEVFDFFSNHPNKTQSYKHILMMFNSFEHLSSIGVARICQLLQKHCPDELAQFKSFPRLKLFFQTLSEPLVYSSKEEPEIILLNLHKLAFHCTLTNDARDMSQLQFIYYRNLSAFFDVLKENNYMGVSHVDMNDRSGHFSISMQSDNTYSKKAFEDLISDYLVILDDYFAQKVNHHFSKENILSWLNHRHLTHKLGDAAQNQKKHKI